MTLVIGGTGILGREIVRRLHAEGQPVRALVRPTSEPVKRQALEQMGAEIATGDLKDPASIAAACRGVTNVISTASSTISRGAGDTIDSVDRDGQLTAIRAAKAAGAKHFVLVSFPESEIAFPLQDAKRAAEHALKTSGMTYTIVQTPHFWEIWCSPILGFDAQNRKARIFGDGNGRMNWVSLGDVAAVAIRALGSDAARNRTLTFGGPDALTQLDIVKIFEGAMGTTFELEHVPVEALQGQYAGAADPMQKSFAALMLICAQGGWVFDHEPIRRTLHSDFASIRDMARQAASS
jgi:uncharacterized protein YbjT (DUF2867 family)